MVSVPARRQQVAYGRGRGLSVRRACTLLSVARSALEYRSRKGAKDASVVTRMKELSAQYPRYGHSHPTPWNFLSLKGSAEANPRPARGYPRFSSEDVTCSVCQAIRALGLILAKSSDGCASLRRPWRGSGRVSASTGDAADRLGEILAAALSSVAERFRGGAHLRGEAARLSGEAAKIGTHTLRRLSHEVEHRPLATIAVAVSVGILVGLMMNRR
jgi:ElaB/YqjD/DUF883 family membrane-anchored ribosome-binding protein